jgi:hypothetical protein
MEHCAEEDKLPHVETAEKLALLVVGVPMATTDELVLTTLIVCCVAAAPDWLLKMSAPGWSAMPGSAVP